MRWLSDLAGSLRTSFGIGRATVNASALTAARTVTLPDRSINLGDQWEFVPIGVPFDLWDHMSGAQIPPTDNPNYRYIKLTASDSYNSGVLTSESLTGAAPHLQATAVISAAASPLNGATVQLINTGRWLLRPGQSGVVELDALQNITGSLTRVLEMNSFPSVATGAMSRSTVTNAVISRAGTGAQTDGYTLSFDASQVSRTATETRPKSIGATKYMRIY